MEQNIMSNQRPGKRKPASMTDAFYTGPMKQLEFFKSCKEVLAREGQEDAAFYFEQIEDWLREGKDLYKDPPGRILGL